MRLASHSDGCSPRRATVVHSKGGCTRVVWQAHGCLDNAGAATSDNRNGCRSSQALCRDDPVASICILKLQQARSPVCGQTASRCLQWVRYRAETMRKRLDPHRVPYPNPIADPTLTPVLAATLNPDAKPTSRTDGDQLSSPPRPTCATSRCTWCHASGASSCSCFAAASDARLYLVT